MEVGRTRSKADRWTMDDAHATLGATWGEAKAGKADDQMGRRLRGAPEDTGLQMGGLRKRPAPVRQLGSGLPVEGHIWRRG